MPVEKITLIPELFINRFGQVYCGADRPVGCFTGLFENGILPPDHIVGIDRPLANWLTERLGSTFDYWQAQRAPLSVWFCLVQAAYVAGGFTVDTHTGEE